jgi:alkylhydroperoxidase/carboxymuconolactone decarboxylase family protein YurZ
MENRSRICVLAAMDQPAQFESHARGAPRLGATPLDLSSALDVAQELAP